MSIPVTEKMVNGLCIRKYKMSRTYVIGEIGINHNGNINIAKNLVDCAKLADVDCVKFQYFVKEETEEVWNKIKDYALDQYMLDGLISCCRQRNIDFLCSAFGKVSATVLKDLGQTAIKIPSGKIVDLEYLEYISKLFNEFYISTGMANFNEVEDAVKALGHKNKVNIMHCVSAYPAPFDSLNLNAIKNLQEYYPLRTIGFSDHSLDICTGGLAVAVGAKVIEKHLTLDCKMEGPDHNMSLIPDELKMYVDIIRSAEKALGNGKIKCEECEKELLFRRQS